MSKRKRNIEEVDTSDEESSTSQPQKKKRKKKHSMSISFSNKQVKPVQVEEEVSNDVDYVCIDTELKKKSVDGGVIAMIVKNRNRFDNLNSTLRTIIFDKEPERNLDYLKNMQKMLLKKRDAIWFGTPMMPSKDYIADGVLGVLNYHRDSRIKNKPLVSTGFPKDLPMQVSRIWGSKQFYPLKNQFTINVAECMDKSTYFIEMFVQIDNNVKKKNMIVEYDNWEWLKKACKSFYEHKDTQVFNKTEGYRYKSKYSTEIFSSFEGLWEYVNKHWQSLYTDRYTHVKKKVAKVSKDINLNW